MMWRVAFCLLLLCGGLPQAARAEAPAVGRTESEQIQLLLGRDNAAALRRSRALVARAQHGPPAALAEGYWLLGCALRNQSRFDSSLYYGQRSLTLYSRLGQPTGMASAYTLLAQTYKRLADAQHVTKLTEQALNLATLAVAAGQQAQPPAVLSRAYVLQGIIYRDLKLYDSARVCYQRAMVVARRYPLLPSSLPVAYADYGQLLMEADHQPAAAIEWFRRAIPLYRREDNRNGLEHAYRNLSWAYQKLGDTAQAVATADSSLALGRASGDPHRLNNSLEVAYSAYRAAGRLAPALDLLAAWKESTDKLASADIVSAVTATRASYELEQQASRIGRLNRSNQQQRRLLWDLGVSLALVLGLLGLVLGQYWALRRSNRRLSASSRIIEANHTQLTAQSERLAVLLQEVHHRIKNNLATVAGLLRLQAARLTDPEALRAMRESQQRIEAISLLHQGLYQTSDVSTVDMRRYITDLTQSLWATHQTSKEIDLQLELATVHLDVEVAVPLGLLLNELVTNAFKHAFDQADTPRLRVAFGPDASGRLLLEVQDNGPGFNPAVQANNRFGRRLIPALAKQLAAQLSLSITDGTHYQLLLPCPT
ncbi:tetratricopeptide repeat protein [Hymenobacter sp. RP-2-7]|uniref:histidine kinase n=1 Tax=Hymenobacter polaris TaxID=2682546 RepID=A0A7Y0FLH4_9BACT|nr:histidine kinase dimerization/phosphoacceptor domain -containing protein [Hymenobacter polaris]NML64411.1 tetratricopeptide repeat protein [Hymenobacter polaris]